MRFFRRRRRERSLTERDCYTRLHGTRSDDIVLLPPPAAAEPAAASAPEPAPDGPRSETPALHLTFAYPRGGARMTGDEVRVALLARMEARRGD